MRTTRPTASLRLARRAVVALSLLALAGSVFPVAVARAASTQALFELVDTLDRFAPDARAALGEDFVPDYEDTNFEQKGRNGTAIMIPELRQLWQIYQTQSSAYAAIVRDLDTMKINRTVELPLAVDRGTFDNASGDWAQAVDAKGKRLFLVSQSNREVMEVDLVDFSVQTRRLPASLQPLITLNGLIPLVQGGITYDPFGDDLLLLYGGPQNVSVADTNTFVYTMDVSVPPQLPSPANFRHLASCTGPLSTLELYGTTFGWEILPTKDLLYIPCQRAGNAGTVVRTARATLTNPRPAEDIVVGPVNIDNVLPDSKSGRIFMQTMSREIWAFDTMTMSFVGVVGTSPEATRSSTGYGLDRETGRLFFQSAGFGLGVVEGRFFPIPQARTMPEYRTGQERILSDTRTGRVFVLGGFRTEKDREYRIYRTEPAPVPPPPPDPDRNTVDMPEKEGVTETRYFASGTGYGVRALLAKGLSTVPPAPTIGGLAPTATAIDKFFNSRCGYTDRELVAGRVRKAEYDTGATAASAIALDVDGATKQDLDKPSRCDVTLRDHAGTQRFGGIFGTGPGAEIDKRTQARPDDPSTPADESDNRWRWDQAECTSSDEAGKAGDDADEVDFGPSSVRCPVPGGKLTATATATLEGSGVMVSRAWTDTVIERSSEGVRATVTAVAQGVSIANGAITFDEIRSTATSRSNGRPVRDDMSTHTVEIRGAEINGVPVCDGTCADPVTLVNTLNRATGGRAVFRTSKGDNGGLDRDLKRGSPGGALTAVQKSAARQASDRALVGDFTIEVAALEMTVFNDNSEWGRARQVYQFAGVASAATYNIVPRPTGIGFTEDPPTGEPGLPKLGNSPYAGIIEDIVEDGTILDGTVGTSNGSGTTNSDGGLVGAFRALARGIRLFFTSPRHSLLLLTAWALFSLPGVLSRRRRLLAEVRSGS